MLARNEGKTAQELGITDIEREALVMVMNMLRTGEIKFGALSNPGPGKRINMATWRMTDECGTVACVGGWCQLLTSGKAFAHTYGGTMVHVGDYQLQRLFFPPRPKHQKANAIANAIESFLMTGQTKWEKYHAGD